MNSRLTQIYRWFDTPLGQRLLAAESEAIQTVLPRLFGYHLIQVGQIGDGGLLESSRIRHRCLLGQQPSPSLMNPPYSSVFALPEALPLAADSIDVVVLPHILEFAEDPHEILREIERVLIPEGHLLILGFNPISLWGISRWFLAQRQQAPWCGRFLSLSRLKDWLALLGFEVVEQQVFFFAMPFHHDHLKPYMVFLENLAHRWTSHLGAVYLLVAKKRVTTLIPIKPRWQPQPALVPGAIGTHFENHPTHD